MNNIFSIYNKQIEILKKLIGYFLILLLIRRVRVIQLEDLFDLAIGITFFFCMTF